MSRFGWAYVNSAITGAVANGPTNSVQFNSGSQVLSGSSNFTFDPSTNKVTLLGELTGSTLVISASVVSASTYLGISGGGSTLPGGIEQTIQFNSGSTFSGSNNFTFDYATNTLYLTGTLRADNLIVSSSQILKSGSTIFGDDLSDTHQFTGSILGGIVSGTIARFVAITGSTITGSNGLLTTLSASYISSSIITFDTSLAADPAFKTGQVFYSPDTNNLSFHTDITDIKLNIGQQKILKVKNFSGTTINKGKIVHITGGVGDNPLINTASWENDANSANTLGMVMRDIPHDNFGYVMLNGVITNVNTDPATFTAGQVIYLSSSGDYTAISPVAPKHNVRIGEVIRADSTVGSIFINIDNGYEIDELHNVLITSASTGDLLTYNSSSALWTNSKNLSGSYTITGSLVVSGTTENSIIVSSSSPALKVTQQGSGISFIVEDQTGPDPSPFAITATGDVGIGTAVPTDKLHVVGSIKATTTITGATGIYTVVSSSILSSSLQTEIGGNAIIAGSVVGSQAIKGGYATYSSNFTASATSYFVGVDSTGGVITASLDSATNYLAGQTMYFKDIGGGAGTNNIRIQPSGSQTIDGAAGGVIIANNSGSITLVSNGTDQFYIVGIV